MPKGKKTTHQFKEEVYELVQDEYTVLGEYTGWKNEILIQHNSNECNHHVFSVSPNSFLHNNVRCKKCYSRFKTDKQFKKEVYELVGNEYTVIEKYISNRTKIKMRHNCKKCNNYEYEVTPNKFLRGKRCPVCSKINRKKTTKQFKQEIYNKTQGEYQVVSEYDGYRNPVKIKHISNICNNFEFVINPESFLIKQQCPECRRIITNKSYGGRTHEQFIRQVYEKFNNDYTVLGRYTKGNSKILIRHNCLDCNNHAFYMIANNFLQSNGCPKCEVKERGLKHRKTHTQFIAEVKKSVGDDYTILGEYVLASNKILIRHNCNKCNNYEFYMTPHSFLQGKRCPKCQRPNYHRNTELFKKEVTQLVGTEYTVLGEYIQSREKIKMRHNSKKCSNHIWYITPDNFLRGFRCPVCNESKNEKKIRNWLKQNNISFDSQYTFDDLKGVRDGLLKFDFAIFEDKEQNKLKCLIEYDGEFHYKKYYVEQNFEIQQIHDQRKDNYCKEHNIKLIRIPYWEQENLLHILKEKLK
ncbi:hypothetical protein G8S55_06425 [Clostridium botulinum C]|uniref:hypothetical protein n=1 Tax=Clostridium botulinum TaxID=1491 RepID=UPI001E4817E1|nr:hypothetical protein [Clostridium botulinum]MCD3216889.1 hypothetical protein [Clostridium botulinum C]